MLTTGKAILDVANEHSFAVPAFNISDWAMFRGIVEISEEKDGSYVLDGGLAVRDLNRRLKLQLPESEAYTTIAGFLMTEAGHVLQPGEMVKHDGLLFHIERVERRRVMRVRLEKTEEPTIEEAEEAIPRAGVTRGDLATFAAELRKQIASPDSGRRS